MATITDEINAERAKRQLEYDENQNIRKLIGDKINEYKAAEAIYKKTVESQQSKMADYEKTFTAMVA